MNRFCFLVFLFVITVSHNLFSQISEGSITCLMTYIGLDQFATQKAFSPNVTITYFTNKNSRSEMSGPTRMKITTTSTYKGKNSLFDEMGNLPSYRKSISYAGKAEKIFVTEEKKRIDGENSQKAIVAGDEEEQSVRWFTQNVSGSSKWVRNYDKIVAVPIDFFYAK